MKHYLILQNETTQQRRIADLAKEGDIGIRICISPTGKILFDNKGGLAGDFVTTDSYDGCSFYYVVATREGTAYKIRVRKLYNRITIQYVKIQMCVNQSKRTCVVSNELKKQQSSISAGFIFIFLFKPILNQIWKFLE